MSLKKNIVANYLGQGWTALIGLAFVPLYIRYLGMEAYGLIGLFAVIQAWLGLLDMGMAPSLNREMARYSAGAHSPQSIRDLLRTIEILCLCVAAAIALSVWAASSYLASDWLKAEKLPTPVVTQALSALAVVVALRFVEGIYRGALFGLERQVWYNSANAIIATFRNGGAIAVLAWISPTVQAFFHWQAAISLLSVTVLSLSVHRALPKAPSPAKFSRKALADVWKFAGGMMGITFLALLLTQVDKVLLSRLLTLESFGYYTLSATVSGAVGMVIGPVTQALYPRMVELSTNKDQTTLVSAYHQGAQLVTVLTAPAAGLLSFFAGGVVFMWSGDAGLAEKTAPILSVLVMGSLLNGLMSIPYQCQLAHGWTGLTLKINTAAVAVLVPAIFWAVPLYGAVGAAWIWVTLNAAYVLIDIQLMHRRVFQTEKWRWYFADVTQPTLGAMSVLMLAKQFQPAGFDNRMHWIAFLFITIVLALAASTALANRIRPRIVGLILRSLGVLLLKTPSVADKLKKY